MTDELRVLIVDDSQGVREQLRTLYRELGHRVVGECGNGLKAIELVRELSPDLVSLDIIMPEMDGIEAYRILRHLENPPRCLIVSALGSEPRVLAAYEREILPTHYCAKPVTRELLSEKIAAVMADTPMPLPALLDNDAAEQDEGIGT
ncbi:MAG: response regulator [Oligoflexus sp.]